MFGALRRPTRLSVEEAGRRVLSGDLAVGEAARLTGRTKAEIATAVEHAIFLQSRIGLEDERRRRKAGRGRLWIVLAIIALALEGIAAAMVFRFDTRTAPAALAPRRAAAPPAGAPGTAAAVSASCAMTDDVRRVLATFCARLIDAATRPECRCMR